MQTITLIGFLGKDPEERLTPSQAKVTTFSIGVNVYHQKENKTQWYKINIWNGGLTNIVSKLKKGSLVCICGDLELPRVYQGKDGNHKVDLSVRANSIKFLPSKKEDKKILTPQEEKLRAIEEGNSKYPDLNSDNDKGDPNVELPF